MLRNAGIFARSQMLALSHKINPANKSALPVTIMNVARQSEYELTSSYRGLQSCNTKKTTKSLVIAFNSGTPNKPFNNTVKAL